MTHDLRFHVSTIPNVPWPEMRERYLWMEEIGVDVAATADHFVDWTNPGQPFFEGWTGLAAVAAVTSTMKLTISVTQIPLRSPALLAHMAVNVDHICNGRLIVGLGTGLRIDASTEMAGIENWSNGERVERFGEYVQILDMLLAGTGGTFEGEYYRISDAKMAPGPLQDPRPPIMIAAMGPRMLGHAARYADVWNSLSFAESFDEQLEQTEARVQTVKATCDEIGRDFDDIRRSFTLFDFRARRVDNIFSYYEDIDDFRARVRAAVDLGMSEIGIYYPTEDRQLPAFEHVVRDVIPELKAELGA